MPNPLYPGFEELKLEAERKRRLAELLSKKAYGNHEPYVSPFQALGQIAQALAATNAGRRADLAEKQMAEGISAKRKEAAEGFFSGIGTPQDRASAALINPYTPETISDLASERLKPDMKNINGQFVDLSQVQSGDLAPRDPNSLGWPTQNGGIQPNPLPLLAATARGGQPIDTKLPNIPPQQPQPTTDVGLSLGRIMGSPNWNRLPPEQQDELVRSWLSLPEESRKRIENAMLGGQ